MTNGEFVSGCISELRLVNKDDHIPKSLVLEIGRGFADLYMTQKFGDGRLTKLESLVTYIDCLPMVEVDAIRCDIVEFKVCKKLCVSEDKIPGLLDSKNGSSIISVTNIDGSMVFTPTSLGSYSNRKNRRHSNKIKTKNYYVLNGKLYIPEYSFERINVAVITTKPDEAEKLSKCSGGGTSDDSSGGCKSIWDSEFVCNEDTLQAVKQATVAQLGNGYRRFVPDENPNMDEHEKSRTING